MRAKVLAAAVGVSAGLSASLPSFVCTGAPCSSCFACVGAGGAVVSALLVGLVTRSRAARFEAARRPPSEAAPDCDATTRHPRVHCDQLDSVIQIPAHRRKP
jgi:hypothetical protein